MSNQITQFEKWRKRLSHYKEPLARWRIEYLDGKRYLTRDQEKEILGAMDEDFPAFLGQKDIEYWMEELGHKATDKYNYMKYACLFGYELVEGLKLDEQQQALDNIYFYAATYKRWAVHYPRKNRFKNTEFRLSNDQLKEILLKVSAEHTLPADDSYRKYGGYHKFMFHMEKYAEQLMWDMGMDVWDIETIQIYPRDV